MHFGLKNVYSTYQTLVYQVFKTKIGQNVNVYVDNIASKSCKMVDFARDMEEKMWTLR